MIPKIVRYFSVKSEGELDEDDYTRKWGGKIHERHAKVTGHWGWQYSKGFTQGGWETMNWLNWWTRTTWLDIGLRIFKVLRWLRGQRKLKQIHAANAEQLACCHTFEKLLHIYLIKIKIKKQNRKFYSRRPVWITRR